MGCWSARRERPGDAERKKQAEEHRKEDAARKKRKQEEDTLRHHIASLAYHHGQVAGLRSASRAERLKSELVTEATMSRMQDAEMNRMHRMFEPQESNRRGNSRRGSPLRAKPMAGTPAESTWKPNLGAIPETSTHLEYFERDAGPYCLALASRLGELGLLFVFGKRPAPDLV